MEEQLISFNTAVLAKKLGLNMNYGKNFYTDFDEVLHECEYIAVTQSLLQRWLREKHNIHINCMFSNREDINGYFYGIIESKEFENNEVYKTYEEALEEALYQALLLIKKQK